MRRSWRDEYWQSRVESDKRIQAVRNHTMYNKKRITTPVTVFYPRGYNQSQLIASKRNAARQRRMALYAARSLANQRSSGFLAQELKFVDYNLTDSALTTALTTGMKDPATVLCLNAVAQGDGPSSRDGREIINKSVHVKGTFYVNGGEAETDTGHASYIHYGIIRDTQTNGAQAGLELVYEDDAQIDALAFRNLEYSKRFQVVVSKTMVLAPRTLSHFAVNSFSWSEMMKHFSLNYRCPPTEKTQFIGTTAVVSNVTNISYHFFAIADNVTNTPMVSYTSRFRFQG